MQNGKAGRITTFKAMKRAWSKNKMEKKKHKQVSWSTGQAM